MIGTRYLFSTVLVATLGVLLVLVTVNSVFAFVEELGEHLTAAQVLQHTFLSLPRRCYEILPFAAMIGALVGLGSLAAGSEIVVMRASGVSLGKVALVGSIPGLLLVVLGIGLGEFVIPNAERAVERLRAQGEYVIDAIPLRRSLWLREDDRFVGVDALGADGELVDVLRFEFDDSYRLQRVSRAESATFLDTPPATATAPATTGLPVPGSADADTGGWLMHGVTSSRFAGQEVVVGAQPLEWWNSTIQPTLVDVSALLPPERLSLAALTARIDFLSGQGLATGEAELAYWNKVMQPLGVVALSLVGISFVLGPLRNNSMSQRLAIGVLVGLAFNYAQGLLAPASLLWGFSAWIAALLPGAITAIVGVVLLRRAA